MSRGKSAPVEPPPLKWTVRTREGVLGYPSLGHVARGVRLGLVDLEDELSGPGLPAPIRVGDHPTLKSQPRAGAAPVGDRRGHLETGAALAAALVALTGMLARWSPWVVGIAVIAAVWLSTRVALRAARRKRPR